MTFLESAARYAILPLLLGYIIQRAIHIAIGIYGSSIPLKEGFEQFVDRYSDIVIRLRIIFSSWAIGLIIVYAMGAIQ